MTPTSEHVQTLADLIGAEALSKLRAEFGGSQLYIPAPPSDKAVAVAATDRQLDGFHIAVSGGAVLTAIETSYESEMRQLMSCALTGLTPEERRECLAKAERLIARRHELLDWAASATEGFATSTPPPPAA